MDTEALRAERLEEVDQRAGFERAGEEYIIDLIETNEPALNAAFIRDGFISPNTDEAELPQSMYAEVQRALTGMSQEFSRYVGVVLRYRTLTETKLHPVVAMGWATYEPALPVKEDWPANKKFPHLLCPTKAGLDVVNGYQAAKGLASVEEVKAAQREAFEEMIAYGDKLSQQEQEQEQEQ